MKLRLMTGNKLDIPEGKTVYVVSRSIPTDYSSDLESISETTVVEETPKGYRLKGDYHQFVYLHDYYYITADRRRAVAAAQEKCRKFIANCERLKLEAEERLKKLA